MVVSMFAAPPPPQVDAVRWLEEPSASDIADAALLMGAPANIPLELSLSCVVRGDGRLEACNAGGGQQASWMAAEALRLKGKYRLDRLLHPSPSITFTLRFPKRYDRDAVASVQPTEAQVRALGEKGATHLICSIGIDGIASRCRSVGLDDRDQPVRPAAEQAVALYRFKPALLNGAPVEVRKFLTLSLGTADITEPQWQQQPAQEFLNSLFPQMAGLTGLDGQVLMNCEVTVSGTLSNCRVEQEYPTDSGFGEAALGAASKFRMKPALRDGSPVGGRHVRIPIRFKGAGSRFGSETVRFMESPPYSAVPTADDVLAVFPEKAKAQRVFKKRSFRCRIGEDGSLRDCDPVDAHEEAGFDAAARPLLSKFRVAVPNYNPNRDGPIYINVPIDFSAQALDRPTPRYLKSIAWYRSPAPSQVLAAYPPSAANAGILSGTGVVDCAITASGTLQECMVVGETPPAAGFGASALAIASLMQASLWTRNGDPTSGGRVRLPLKFIYSGDDAKPPSAPSNPSP